MSFASSCAPQFREYLGSNNGPRDTPGELGFRARPRAVEIIIELADYGELRRLGGGGGIEAASRRPDHRHCAGGDRHRAGDAPGWTCFARHAPHRWPAGHGPGLPSALRQRLGRRGAAPGPAATASADHRAERWAQPIPPLPIDGGTILRSLEDMQDASTSTTWSRLMARPMKPRSSALNACWKTSAPTGAGPASSLTGSTANRARLSGRARMAPTSPDPALPCRQWTHHLDF